MKLFIFAIQQYRKDMILKEGNEGVAAVLEELELQMSTDLQKTARLRFEIKDGTVRS
jgi:hypothetical protein